MEFVRRSFLFWFSAPLSLAILLAPAAGETSAPPACTLAENGRGALPIVVAPPASPRVRAAAQTLADYLGRISGGRFEVVEGDGARGIVVGLAQEFPRLAGDRVPRTPQPTEREVYLLQSGASSLLVLGASELAVEHGVWDLLHRLGHRQFFPGPVWEVTPRQPTLRVAVAAIERPDFLSRRIWYGFGTTDYNQQPYAEWCARNRCVQGLVLNTGHSYDGIVKAHAAEFAAHPEYLALVGGRRVEAKENAKLCIGNPAVRRLVVAHTLRTFAERPDLDSVSLDPSDGGGWCECEACRALGSVSDRVLRLANEAAAAVEEKHPGKLICIYAYAEHSPPPAIDAHPRVIVNAATAFLRGGHTFEEIFRGWAERKATLGVREYYSVFTWDHDLPGRARGSQLEYLKTTIPKFYAQGARYLSAESSDNWGPNGLGYYLAARLLWDVDEAPRVDAWIEDFLNRAFGPAREPMAEFYRQLDGSRPQLVEGDRLARMYRALDAGRRLASGDPAVRARIDALTLYTRYVDLFRQYAAARGPERQAAFEAVLRHGYRMRQGMLVHVKALYRDLPNRDKSVAVPPDAGWNAPEPKNPWKSSAPFTDEEIEALLRDGIDRSRPVEPGFEPQTFSQALTPKKPAPPPNATPGEYGPGRDQQTFFTYVERGPATLTLEVTGGLIAQYRNRGQVRIEAWKWGTGNGGVAGRTLAAEDRSVPPDGEAHEARLELREAGLYQIVVQDGGDRTRIVQKSSLPWTIESSLAAPLNAAYLNWSLWFYVPRGTKTLGLHGGAGRVLDSRGETRLNLAGAEASYHHCPVPPGTDGAYWRIAGAKGPVRLLTVPPYLAARPEELLLPREIADQER